MKKKHTLVIHRHAKMRFTTRVDGLGCRYEASSARTLLELVTACHPKLLKPGRTLLISVKA